MRLIESGRGRNVTSYRRTPGDDRYLGAGRGRKGGGTGQGKAVTGLREELLGPVRMGGKHRRLVKSGRRDAIQVDGCSAPR